MSGGKVVNGFDAEYYLAHNADVAAAGVDPLTHYMTYGWHEGRNPNADFDTNYYLAHNADVAAAGVNPLQHYEQSGWLEGRNPSTAFNTNAYLAANPDVAAAHVDPLDHYLNYGINEGRLLAPASTSAGTSSGSLTLFSPSYGLDITGWHSYYSSGGDDTLFVGNVSPVDITGHSSSFLSVSVTVASVDDYLLHA
jgi:hypothetical protein